MHDFEKLGVFYLGRVFDPSEGTTTAEPLLYDSRDLTTHGVIVGMTGSGKTGLAVGLLEEAAIDGIPAIAIDPKGDLGNLALTFPDLRPEDFRPWIDEAEASRNQMSPEMFATKTAESWRKGLAEWGQDPARIGRFREAVDLAIYTPGSSAGRPLSVLSSLSAPGAAVAGDADALRERILSAVSGLLGLLGIDADPVRSRDHILLSKILERAWSEGESLDLGEIVRQIQDPPFEKVGVLDLESFYSARDRTGLAMALNNLLASPGFAAWTEGERLDVGRLLWTQAGRPRLSILSIAHLSEAERMFFVTLLLNEVVAWMRSQGGTSSLRALLYMDEVFGYFPPVANPPSKAPMLTLMKQARAYGLGVVLATQNPVDLDYKGLSNAGTWFLGRLQTERDKERVLEGLEGASAAAGQALDRGKIDAILSGLGKRVFLMNNVHEDRPVLFQTRWVLSYLRGPMTKAEVQRLVTPAAPQAAPVVPAPAQVAPVASATDLIRPILPAGVPEFFLPVETPRATVAYSPALFGFARLHFVNARAGVDVWEDVALMAPLTDTPGSPWDVATSLEDGRPDLEKDPAPEARFAPLPAAALNAKSYASWQKGLADHLYRTRTLTLYRSASLKLMSNHGETEGEFRARAQQAMRERRDAELDRLRKKYAPKLAQLQDQERRAVERVEREKGQFQAQSLQTAISVGASVLGALFGRKVASVGNIGRATTAARGFGRAARERRDIGSAEEALEAVRERKAQIEADIEAELDAAAGPIHADAVDVEDVAVRPRKTDITAQPPVLVWVPA